MKKFLFILIMGVILSSGVTAGILTSGAAAKYMMLKMIELLSQKKIDKMTFPKNEGTDRISSSIHVSSTNTLWRFDYVNLNDTEILQIRFFDCETDDNNVSHLVNTIKMCGKSYDDDFWSLGAHMYMYDKEGSMIVSKENMSICTSNKGGSLEAAWLFMNMDKDGGWYDFLDKHDISRIRIVYGNNSYNLKLIDYNSPYSTIEQIRQLSFWVKCPENQLNEIGKKYDVWIE